jgi:transposase
MKVEARFAELVLTPEQRQSLLVRLAAQVSAEDYQFIQRLLEAFPELLGLFNQRGMTLERLRRLAFGAPTEKTATVCPAAAAPAAAGETAEAAPRRRRKGHGRTAARHYTGARRVPVSHPSLRPGQLCPECQQGKLCRAKPAPVVRVSAQPPITAQVFELEGLRCALCGKTFTAPLPAAAGPDKHDPSVGVMAALLRYGSGVPAYRLAQLQRSLGVPLPASTQWEEVEPLARIFQPLFEELLRQGAQAPLLYNDDTKMRISDVRREIRAEKDPQRTGIFTTSILAQTPQHPIALFFTGRQHAGENLTRVLRQRAADLPQPIQMCDGLSRNESSEFESILACCLAHGRRGFVEVAPDFPQECQHVLERLRAVYRFDAQARKEALSPEQRLAWHQTHSRPVMDQLKTWLQDQLDQKRVEPNSGLGQAIGYLLRHWEPLTLFLRVAGAPLDNNICERALKMAILHRKNSLSYKTQRGAEVGDLFMSLIHTCRLNLANPFDYLMALARHPKEVLAHPADWLPWNFTGALAAPAQQGTPPNAPHPASV